MSVRIATLLTFLAACVTAAAVFLPGDEGTTSADGSLPPGVEMRRLTDASEAQQQILEDGVVTMAEYEAAVMANAACLREAGIVFLVEPHLDESGRSFDYRTTGGTFEERHGCNLEHQEFVARQWALQIFEEADVEGARAALRECLVDAGVPGASRDGDLDSGELSRADPEAFAACSEQVSAEFGIPNFAG